MPDRPALLQRLRELLGLAGEGGATPSTSPSADGPSSGCEDVAEITCDEAAKRVYEYLDGELDEERAEAIRCHVERCRRCYPMYDWERLFLDVLRERAERPEPSEELRRRVLQLLDEIPD